MLFRSRLSADSNIINTMEVPVVLRFLFVLITPARWATLDAYQVGRSFSALMANPSFGNVCYSTNQLNEILKTMSLVMEESIVLLPGDWVRKNLLSIAEIQNMREKRLERKRVALSVAKGDVLMVKDGEKVSYTVLLKDSLLLCFLSLYSF